MKLLAGSVCMRKMSEKESVGVWKTADVCLRDAWTAYKYTFPQKVTAAVYRDKRRDWTVSTIKHENREPQDHLLILELLQQTTWRNPIGPQNIHIKPLVVKTTEYRHNCNAQALLAV